MGKGRKYSRSDSVQEAACEVLCLPILGKPNAPLASLANGQVSPSDAPGGAAAASKREERGTWSNPVEFILSCLGYAVGLGNIWRFPFLCYINGGGAFLIPYAIMLILVGIPTFFMELILGQWSGCGPVTVWSLSPLFHGIGVGMILISSLFCIFYTMILGYSLFFLFASFTSKLPWDSCQHDYNTEYCYSKNEAKPCEADGGTWFNQTCFSVTTKVEEERLANETAKNVASAEEFMNNYVLSISPAIEEFGETRWQLVLCLLGAWMLCFLCLLKGIRSSGKVVYFTALFPYVVLTILLIYGCTLDGAIDGIKFYIKPEFKRLKEPRIWADAAGQIFFSLSVGSGGLMTFASYNKFKNNIYRDALIVSIGNCLTSFYAGFAIFAILGYMAKVLGQEVKDVAVEGSTLAFVAYPTVVTQMPVPQLWAILFFLMLITLGLDSLFAGVETVMTAIVDSFPRTRPHKTLLTFLLCFTLFLLGLPMCTEAGIYWLNLIAYYSGGWCLILIGLIEVVVVAWVFGAKKLMDMVEEMTGRRLYWHWWACWKIITPVLLIVILIVNLIDFEPLAFGPYVLPDWAQALGWLMALLSPTAVILFAIIHLANSYTDSAYDGLNVWQRVVKLCRPSAAWGPSYLKTGESGAAPEKAETNGKAPPTNGTYANPAFEEKAGNGTTE